MGFTIFASYVWSRFLPCSLVMLRMEVQDNYIYQPLVFVCPYSLVFVLSASSSLRILIFWAKHFEPSGSTEIVESIH